MTDDPFDMFLGSETMYWILRLLERRWGLVLVSFLPVQARPRLVELQKQIGAVLVGQPDEDLRQSRHYVDYHDPDQFHATQMVFAAGQPSGPVVFNEALRGDPRDLITRLMRVAGRLGPVEVELTEVRVHKAFLAVMGRCVDSTGNRQILLEELNRSVVPDFGVEPRPFETDPEKFADVHVTLGSLKRNPPVGYEHLPDCLKDVPVKTNPFVLDQMSLVHHRHNTLKRPHQGVAHLRFGQDTTLSSVQLVEGLKLGRAAKF